MIARGDLGVELSPEKVPMVQKRICELCNKMGRPVITATQMLDSMERNPKPTRAEASDVANAILDGTDAVMLSGETATGKYPVRAVEMMRKIILETEREMGYKIRHWTFFEFPEEANINEAISYSACQISKAISAQLICCFTSEGKQPRRISKFRPEQPVVGVTYEDRVANRISLYWGVVAITVKGADILDDLWKVEEGCERLSKLVNALGDGSVSSAAEAGGMSKIRHDLKNPLNSILGYTEIILEEYEDELTPQAVENLEHSIFFLLLLFTYYLFLQADRIEKVEHDQIMKAYQGERNRRKERDPNYKGVDRRGGHIDHGHH